MLYEFLTANRAELIERCRLKVAQRPLHRTSEAALEHGIPHLLDQIIKTLQVERTPHPMASRKVSGPAGGGKPFFSEIGETATRHGRELLQHGYTIDQVVHDYGDLCQAIMDLASERNTPFEIEEYGTLNRCLDNAIADAVTEFSQQHDIYLVENSVNTLNEQLGFLAHELRSHIQTATLAATVLKKGDVGSAGATSAILDRSLIALRSLVDRALADVRVTAGLPPRRERISVANFIAQIKVSAALEANARECVFTASDVDPTLAVVADRDLLFSAAGNLLQNAFKFTRPHTEVSLHAYAAANRILIDVEITAVDSRPAWQLTSSNRSRRAAPTDPVWGWDLQLRGAASRRARGRFAYATRPDRVAFLPSICLATPGRNRPAQSTRSARGMAAVLLRAPACPASLSSTTARPASS